MMASIASSTPDVMHETNYTSVVGGETKEQNRKQLMQNARAPLAPRAENTSTGDANSDDLEKPLLKTKETSSVENPPSIVCKEENNNENVEAANTVETDSDPAPENSSEEVSNKRKRSEENDDNSDGTEELLSMTRSQLVQECRNHKLKTLGKKEDLLRRLLARKKRREENTAITMADLLMLKRTELQQECQAAGLSPSGSKQQLAARLLENNVMPVQVKQYLGPGAASPERPMRGPKPPLPLYRPAPHQTRGRSASEVDAASVILSLALRQDHQELLSGFRLKKGKLGRRMSAKSSEPETSVTTPVPAAAALTCDTVTSGKRIDTPKAATAPEPSTSPTCVDLKSTSGKFSVEKPRPPPAAPSREPMPPPGKPKAGKSTTPRRWTREEDQALIMAVNQNGGTNWKAIAKSVPGRNHEQCLQRWRKALDPRVVKGKWSPEEDRLLLSLLEQSPKNWGYVAMGIVGRTAKQCRERFHSHLDPAIKKGDWNPMEDKLLIQHQKLLGNRWAEISRALRRAGFHGRTENSVKIRWKVLQRKEKRKRMLAVSANIIAQEAAMKTTAEQTPKENTISNAQDGVKQKKTESLPGKVESSTDTTLVVVVNSSDETKIAVPSSTDGTQVVVASSSDGTKIAVPGSTDAPEAVVPSSTDAAQVAVPNLADAPGAVVPSSTDAAQVAVPNSTDATTAAAVDSAPKNYMTPPEVTIAAVKTEVDMKVEAVN